MQPQESPPTSVLAGILSYLVPGLGQIIQGRVGKGLLFFVCLVSLFHVGQAMGNWQNVYLPTSESRWARDQARPQNPLASIVHYRWHYAGQFWIGVAAWPALWQFYEMPTPDPQRYPFLSRYQRAPDEETEVNPFLVNSDKTPDLGLIYTVIAGVLNILVIYDAFAGPAFPLARPGPGKEPKPEGAT
jgi:hypothetical protein